MTDAQMAVPNQTPPAPPPTPPGQQNESRCSRTFTSFLIQHFWWIIGAAVLVKLTAYFIAPQPPSTIGGHAGAVLRKFVVFGVTLSIVALVVAQFFQQKRRMFTALFAALFASACLLNLPTAVLLRLSYSEAKGAARNYLALFPEKDSFGRKEFSGRSGKRKPNAYYDAYADWSIYRSNLVKQKDGAQCAKVFVKVRMKSGQWHHLWEDDGLCLSFHTRSDMTLYSTVLLDHILMGREYNRTFEIWVPVALFRDVHRVDLAFWIKRDERGTRLRRF